MKVLFINNYLHEDYAGGAEQSSRILVQDLSKNNELYTLSFWNEDKVQKRDKVINIYIKEGVLLKTRYLQHFIRQVNLNLCAKVRRIIDRINPDIIHFNNIQGFPALLVRSLRDFKVIHTLRDYNTLCFRNSIFKNNSRCEHCNLCKLQSNYKIWAYKSINGIASNSKLTLDIHNAYKYKKKQQTVIYAGYSEVNSFNKKISDNITVGYIGKINKSKGCQYLNNFAQEIRNLGGNKLLVAGTGDPDLKKNFDKSNIEYLGFCQPKDFYPKTDVIIIPSIWYDPLPRVIYEAMSYNVVPFVSIFTGGKNVIRQIDEKLLFDPECPESINAICKLITDKEYLNIMKNKISEIVENREFSIRNASDEYEQFYDEIFRI